MISMLFSFAMGCGGGADSKREYPYKPLIKPDLMWDTETLFSRTVTVTQGRTGDYTNKNGVTQAVFLDGADYKGKPTTVFCYLGFPSSEMPEGGYPAMVLVHGGGGCAFYAWVEYWNGKGYAAIAIDTYAHQYGSTNGVGEVNPNGGPVDSGSFQNTKETFYDSWVYHSVYNIISAHNVLIADERINSEKIGLTGISWGSVLTCITAGVDYRFQAFAPVYGSGFLLETPGVKDRDYFTEPDNVEEWIECYDPISYLNYCNRPIMFAIGTNDSFFSPLLQQQSSDLCEGKVYHSYRGNLTHYHRWKDEEGMIFVYDFMEQTLNGKQMPLTVKSEKSDGKNITVEIDGAENLKTARLIYCVSDKGVSTSWRWSVMIIPKDKIKQGKISAEVPEDAKYAFIELSDGKFNEFVISSSLFTVNQ